MAKETIHDQQNITHTTEDGVTRTPRVKSAAPE